MSGFDMPVSGRSWNQRSLRAFQTSSHGHCRAHSKVASGNRVVAPGSGRSSRRSSTSRPQPRSSRIMSPWPRWKSTDSSSGHSNRCMPKYGRSSRSVAGRPSVSGTVSMSSTEFTRKISWPPGAQQPGRLGDPGVGVAPDAGAVLRDRQVEAGVGERCLLGAGVDEREPQAETVLQLARGGQLRHGVVQPDRPRAAAG
jgi:hypothetical protein